MILEIRTYRVAPGKLTAFVDMMRGQTVPLLTAAGIDVLVCAPSVECGDAPQPDAFLIRVFDDLAARRRADEEFHASSAWVDGPRDDVLNHILDYHTVVLKMPGGGVVEAMQQTLGTSHRN